MGINGRYVEGAFTHAEGRFRSNKNAEYLLDLPLVTLDLLLVRLGVWPAYPPPKSPLDFTHKPGVV